MKPKTIIQKRVDALRKRLPALSKAQITWAENQSYAPVWEGKGHLTCLDCGHKITDPFEIKNYEILHNTYCPGCGKKVKRLNKGIRTWYELYFVSIHTTLEEFQVFRSFEVRNTCWSNKSPKYDIREVCQYFINPNGKAVSISRTLGLYRDNFMWTPMEVRKFDPSVPEGNIYPRRRYIPELIRNGFNPDDEHFSNRYFAYRLLNFPYAETLYKAGQREMLIHFKNSQIEQYWPEIKICLRRKYIVKDVRTWDDHVRMLKTLNMDTLNHIYLCPENLKQEHQKLIMRINAINAKKNLADMELRFIKEQKDYEKHIKPFKDFKLVDGMLSIIPLVHVKEVYTEGKMLSHCVYASGYHKNNNALLLSARIDNTPVETIEVKLKDFSISQARGLNNQSSEYHDQILSMLSSNMKQLQTLKKKKHYESTI